MQASVPDDREPNFWDKYFLARGGAVDSWCSHEGGGPKNPGGRPVAAAWHVPLARAEGSGDAGGEVELASEEG